MRIRVALDDALVAELDRRAGSRPRSEFAAEMIARGLEDERRQENLEAAFGSLPDTGHEWDDDPAAWVRQQRRFNSRSQGNE